MSTSTPFRRQPCCLPFAVPRSPQRCRSAADIHPTTRPGSSSSPCRSWWNTYSAASSGRSPRCSTSPRCATSPANGSRTARGAAATRCGGCATATAPTGRWWCCSSSSPPWTPAWPGACCATSAWPTSACAGTAGSTATAGCDRCASSSTREAGAGPRPGTAPGAANRVEVSGVGEVQSSMSQPYAALDARRRWRASRPASP